MINIVGNTAKKRHHRKLTRMMEVFDAILAKEIKAVLNRQFFDVAKIVEKGSTSITLVLFLQNDRLKKILLRHYKRIGRRFSIEVLKSFDILKLGKKGVFPDEIKQENFDEFWKAFNEWTITQTASQVTKIQNTTRSILAGIINKGVAEGLGAVKIAKNIRSTGLIANPKRALKIARTETHTASVFAIDTAVNKKVSDLHVKSKTIRNWSTAGDLRVRGAKGKSRFNHVKANNQKRSMEKPFNVSGELLMRPGDPNGSPGNIINCRCVILYKIVRNKKLFTALYLIAVLQQQRLRRMRNA
jgi:uncharacterized protein with gpF-like domain